MSAIAEPLAAQIRAARHRRAAGSLFTLARRRAALTASNPRQVLVPLLGTRPARIGRRPGTHGCDRRPPLAYQL